MTALATVASGSNVIEPAIPAPSGPAARFTLDGSDNLERQLACACGWVLSGVRAIVPSRKLEALLLGGGYGRGEGGVLHTESDDQPYNDLEFYVFVRGNTWSNQRRYAEAFHRLADDLRPGVGVEVEFKIMSLAKLRRSPVSMFYYDLVSGHRWLSGDERLLAGCDHHFDARNIPPSEATRLLMNRGSGLLFAREKLEHQPLAANDADFVGRNLAKAQLALGDAVLTVLGQYHWSCRERHNRLQRLGASDDLPWLPEVRHHHTAGVEFKLHPRRAPPDASSLRAQHEILTALALPLWLWLESRRLGFRFESAGDYALSPLNRCPGMSGWRNCVINVLTSGPGLLLRPGVLRHPQDRLLRALTLLLWEQVCPTKPRELSQIQQCLLTQASTFPALVHTYCDLWRRFN